MSCRIAILLITVCHDTEALGLPSRITDGNMKKFYFIGQMASKTTLSRVVVQFSRKIRRVTEKRGKHTASGA